MADAVKVIHAARTCCLCGQKMASTDGGKTWKCARFLMGTATKECQAAPDGKKILDAEGAALAEAEHVRGHDPTRR